jgi:hypothetical protein
LSPLFRRKLLPVFMSNTLAAGGIPLPGSPAPTPNNIVLAASTIGFSSLSAYAEKAPISTNNARNVIKYLILVPQSVVHDTRTRSGSYIKIDTCIKPYSTVREVLAIADSRTEGSPIYEDCSRRGDAIIEFAFRVVGAVGQATHPRNHTGTGSDKDICAPRSR